MRVFMLNSSADTGRLVTDGRTWWRVAAGPGGWADRKKISRPDAGAVTELAPHHLAGLGLTDVGGAVAARCRALGLCYATAARRCGLARPHLVAIVTGRKSPTLVTLEKLAIGLQCAVGDLVR